MKAKRKTIPKKLLGQFPEPLRSQIAFRAARLFLAEGTELSAEDVAAEVRSEFKLNEKPLNTKLFNKNHVYLAVRVVVEEKMLLWNPPINWELGDRLLQKYELAKGDDKDTVRVVDVGLDSPNSVSDAAAELALRLMLKRHEALNKNWNGDEEKLKPVVLGLGPGKSTLHFSRQLGELLKREGQSEAQNLRIKLVGISSGCPPNQPEYAPVSFFNLFPDRFIKGRVALLAGPLVKQDSHSDRLKTRVGLREAYAIRDTIDIVVTSMGDFVDVAHDGLAKLLEDQVSKCDKNDWVGSVQYRPYSSTAPVTGDQEDFRVVTLFELEDLKHMARDADKSVILIARPCSLCKATKSRAMRPLLEKAQLRVFSHLVIDSGSARELL